LHHPAAHCEVRGVLVSALVNLEYDWGGLYMRLGECQERHKAETGKQNYPTSATASSGFTSE
jgi:hypothetical protein